LLLNGDGMIKFYLVVFKNKFNTHDYCVIGNYEQVKQFAESEASYLDCLYFIESESTEWRNIYKDCVIKNVANSVI